MTFYDIIQDVVNANQQVRGVFLAKPTGNVLDEDETFVELEFQNKIIYGKIVS